MPQFCVVFYANYTILATNSVRKILKSGGAGTLENLRKTKIRIKTCSTQNQSDFLPKIRRRAKKKDLHSNLVRFFAQA